MSQKLFEVSGLNSYLPSAERRQHLVNTNKYHNSMYYIADSIDESSFKILTDTDMLVMLMWMNGFRRVPLSNGQHPLPLLQFTMFAFQKEIEHRIINDKDKISSEVSAFRAQIICYLHKVVTDLKLEIKPDDLRYGNDRIYMFDLGDRRIT